MDDMQSWWDELVTQLAEEQPDRDSVIECLQQLLAGAARGDDLPQVTEMSLQDWLDELLAQLAAAEPDRAIIIECLQRLLAGAALGEPLPRIEEGTC
jgi:hypothetical protein